MFPVDTLSFYEIIKSRKFGMFLKFLMRTWDIIIVTLCYSLIKDHIQ